MKRLLLAALLAGLAGSASAADLATAEAVRELAAALTHAKACAFENGQLGIAPADAAQLCDDEVRAAVSLLNAFSERPLDLESTMETEDLFLRFIAKQAAISQWHP